MVQFPTCLSATRVFAIPEFLEMILQYLTWQEPFAVQRVNRTLLQVIAKSVWLRARMAQHSLGHLKDGKVISPLLRKFFRASTSSKYHLDAVFISQRGLKIVPLHHIWLPKTSIT